MVVPKLTLFVSFYRSGFKTHAAFRLGMYRYRTRPKFIRRTKDPRRWNIEHRTPFESTSGEDEEGKKWLSGVPSNVQRRLIIRFGRVVCYPAQLEYTEKNKMEIAVNGKQTAYILLFLRPLIARFRFVQVVLSVLHQNTMTDTRCSISDRSENPRNSPGTIYISDSDHPQANRPGDNQQEAPRSRWLAVTGGKELSMCLSV